MFLYKMTKYFVSLVTMLLCVSIGLQAQFVKVSGQVTDFMGNPVSGATISFKARRYSWETSNNSGNFSTIRNSLHDSIIICTHVNFRTREQKIENAKTVNFKLYPKEDVHYLKSINDSLIAVIDSADILDEQHFVDSFRAVQSNRLFTKVESDPYFDGGEAALRAYYSVYLRRSNIVLKYNISGVITIGFFIKKDGSISDVKLMKGINKQIDDAIIKSTEIMPKWRPANQNGRNYGFNYVLSIPINLKGKP
jgi:Gram-negative bacterial TonB protein C-terminal